MLLSIILREEYASKWWHGWQAVSFFRERGRRRRRCPRARRSIAAQARVQRRPWRDKHRDKEITSSWTDWRTLVAGVHPCSGKMEMIFQRTSTPWNVVVDPEKRPPETAVSRCKRAHYRAAHSSRDSARDKFHSLVECIDSTILFVYCLSSGRSVDWMGKGYEKFISIDRWNLVLL